MFGLIADLIASITTILLPAYLSYKALRSHDPAQSHPWLIYFTILSLALLFESWTLFIIGWIPFYSWFRLLFLLYLVLPQTQGAKLLYLDYLEPYIIDHETRIDNFITQTHERLQQMGMGYLHIVIEYFRAKVLGQENPQQPQSAQGYASYAQDLLSRFTMPSARGPAEGGVYGMVSGLTGAMAAGRPRDATWEAASIPDSFAREQGRGVGAEQKSKAIAAQRERLSQILRELEVEQQSIDLAYGSGHPQHLSASGLKTKSKSEQSFENLSYDEASGSETVPPKKVTDRRSTSGSWMPAGVSGWWAGSGDEPVTQKKESSKGRSTARDMVDAIAEGSSTGYDREG